MILKYKQGDKLKYIGKGSHHNRFIKGEIFTVGKSKWSGSYRLNEYVGLEDGWMCGFIENKSNFVKVYTSWKERILSDS